MAVTLHVTPCSLTARYQLSQHPATSIFIRAIKFQNVRPTHRNTPTFKTKHIMYITPYQIQCLLKVHFFFISNFFLKEQTHGRVHYVPTVKFMTPTPTRPVIIHVHLASLLSIIFQVDWCDDGKEMGVYQLLPSPTHPSFLSHSTRQFVPSSANTTKRDSVLGYSKTGYCQNRL